MSNDDYVNLTRRKVLGGLAGIGAAGAATGAGTMALYSDSETSGGNTVKAGTLNLTPNSTDLQTVTVDELAPGESSGVTTWTLVNDGSIGGSLDVSVTIQGEADGSDGTPATNENATATEVAKALEVVTLSYGGSNPGQVSASTDPANVFENASSSSYRSLYDLANNLQTSGEESGNDLIDLADPGTGTDFSLELKLRSEAGNKFQADGVEFDIEFVLNQTDGQ